MLPPTTTQPLFSPTTLAQEMHNLPQLTDKQRNIIADTYTNHLCHNKSAGCLAASDTASVAYRAVGSGNGVPLQVATPHLAHQASISTGKILLEQVQQECVCVAKRAVFCVNTRAGWHVTGVV